MNTKGQSALVIAGLMTVVVGVIGVVILGGISQPYHLSTAIANGTEITNGTLNGTANSFTNGCLVPGTTPTFYDHTNDTALAGADVSISRSAASTWTLTDNTHNVTNISAAYNYFSRCDFQTATIIRIILANTEILFALGILAAAGMWFVGKAIL